MPTNPQHIPTIIQPSTSQPQKTHKSRKPKRKDTQVPHPSGPTDIVTDEAVYRKRDDSLVRADTTASSLEAEQDSGSGPMFQETIGDTIAQTRFENVSKTSYDSLLAGVNTPRSDENRLKLKELMELFKKLEKKEGSRTHKLKRLYKVGSSRRVESSKDEGLGEEDASKQGRIADIDDINVDIDVTLVNDVVNNEDMFDVNDLDGEKEVVSKKEVVVNKENVEVVSAADTLAFKRKRKKEEEANIALINTWDDIQARIDADGELAARLQALEQDELTIEEKAKLFSQLLEARRKDFAAKRAEKRGINHQ
ncbi:hypothetical protein Tco_0453771 [Tanacetum coccineum]